ncbi:MAG: zinc ribbon domain-containing protein [Thermoplasmata archaeon]
MVFCPKCGSQLPDGAAFCYKCGSAIPGGGGTSAPAAAPAAPSAPSLGAAGTQVLKCPQCGGPIKPVFGEMVISCDYCGSSVTLGGAGWKEISKHSMLALKVTDQAQALTAVRGYVDAGFMHRHEFEESKVADAKLSFVPFWVVPASASTTYEYQAVATSVGVTVGTMAAGALLGSALTRGRGGTSVVPIFGGPVVNPNRQETISGQFEYPVVAVKSMSAYQPKNYSFALGERTFFDRKGIPDGSVVLNGDLGEDAAKNAARAWVQQLQSEAAHKKHSVVSKLQTNVDVTEAELLHVPIWSFFLERKGARTMFLVDAHAGRVMQTMQ